MAKAININFTSRISMLNISSHISTAFIFSLLLLTLSSLHFKDADSINDSFSNLIIPQVSAQLDDEYGGFDDPGADMGFDDPGADMGFDDPGAETESPPPTAETESPPPTAETESPPPT